MSNKKINAILKIITYLIFYIYLILLIKIVLFKYVSLFYLIRNLNNLNGFRSINVIPFKSIFEFSKIMFTKNFFRGFNNIIVNIFMFSPLGYFLPLMFKKFKNLKNTILLSLTISLTFEICQYFLYLGSTDIDDVILNTMGALIGFLFYKFLCKVIKNRDKLKYFITIILSIIGFVVAGYFAIDYFGIMFGINKNINNSNYKINLDNSEVGINEDNAYTLNGYIEEICDTKIVINRIFTKDLADGTGLAISDDNNKTLININLLNNTKYEIKDIYDINGSKVSIRNGSVDFLKLEQSIEIKGYKEKNKFYANKITINNFLF